MTDRRSLRQRLRAARRAVPLAARPAAAAALDRHLAALALPRPGSRIAAYHPMDGEIDPAIVLQRARALGCAIYYPVITNLRARRMRFVTGESANGGKFLASRWLDLALVPIVGFDARGHRLGMGGGFYDRHFSFLRHRRSWRRPLLVGVAFEVQRIDRLSEAAHDVQLWGIVTDRGIYGRAAGQLRRPNADSGT
jgi:5-formyltetrahydrofolate cyclo-ligase